MTIIEEFKRNIISAIWRIVGRIAITIIAVDVVCIIFDADVPDAMHRLGDVATFLFIAAVAFRSEARLDKMEEDQ